MITATRPFVPAIEKYFDRISIMFQKAWFTNHGDFAIELEKKLAEYFGLKYFVLVSNGTIALQIAIKALNLRGEIITTPFSYVATTSSIVWENCIPVFADIKRQDFNIDPKKIESLITPNTSAILATNVFGYPCDFTEIEKIAKNYNLKVIYDSAHTFGTKINKKSVLNFGDISTISFHSTKLFHSIEGGGIVCNNEDTYNKILMLRNFGHTSVNTFGGLGINGKMNEACAAMGLCNMEYLSEILEKRRIQWQFYFNNIKNSSIELANYNLKNITYNYAYFPIIAKTESKLEDLMNELLKNDIQTRRYFYPSLNTLNYVNYLPCPISESISNRILSLPLFHELKQEDQSNICEIINRKC